MSDEIPDLLYSDAERALSDALASLLADRGGLDKALARIESAQTYDDKLWQAVGADLGCAGLLIPERDGGAGASYREAAAAAEVLGSFVAPVPFLGSAVVATAALLSVPGCLARGSRAAGRDRPAGQDGGRRRDHGAGGPVRQRAGHRASRPRSGWPGRGPVTPRPGWRGCAGWSPGSPTRCPPACCSSRPTACRTALYLVDMAAEGVAKAPVTSLDMTRQLCDLSFDDAPATLIASGPAAARALDAALGAGAGILAAEQTGLAQRCLDMTVAYVKERKQFARPVGSFQGLKHRLADLWVSVTQARAASRYAAACLATGSIGRQGRGGAGQGLLLGGRGAGRAGVRADARRHRLHLGAPGAPVPEAGEGRLDRLRHRGRAPRGAGVPGQPARLDEQPSTRRTCGAGSPGSPSSRRSGC